MFARHSERAILASPNAITTMTSFIHAGNSAFEYRIPTDKTDL